MSFELGEALRRCGLETGGRRLMLDALACYTEEETGLASASQLSLALHAGMTERHAKRLLAELLGDGALQGLVRLVRPAAGRGRTAVYQVMIGRVEPLAAAIKTAQRVARAGVAAAIIDAGLCGKVLSPENMRAAFGVLARLMRAEGNLTAAAAIEAQRALFEAHLASEEPMRGPDGRLPFAEPENTPQAEEESPLSRCGNPCEGPVEKAAERGTFRPEKGDISSGKGDISSSAHSKDNIPSGNNSLRAPDAREAAGIFVVGDATAQGEFFLDPLGMIGHVTACRDDRRAFGEAFSGRVARINEHGALMIRCRTEAEAFELSRRWLEPLVSYAAVWGLSGVAFEVRGPP